MLLIAYFDNLMNSMDPLQEKNAHMQFCIQF